MTPAQKKAHSAFQKVFANWFANKDLAALQKAAQAGGQLVAQGIVTIEFARERLALGADVRRYETRYSKDEIVDCIESGIKAGQYGYKPSASNDNEPHEDDGIDAETLLGMTFSPLSYVIPQYVVEGLTILGGKPKLGKSWLAYDFGVAVATGGKAMGNVECEQGDVLYLALEDNQRRVQSRLQVVAPPRGISLNRLRIRTVAPTLDKGLLAEIDKWRVSSDNPRLVIIDVYMKIRPPRNRGEDVYAADYAAVVPLQRYASEHRLALLLVTHTRKMEAEDPLESISGTNGVTGAADSVLVLTRGAKGGVLYGRGRDIEEIETAMKFEAGRWSIVGNADEVKRSDQRRTIIAVLQENGELGPKAIAELTGFKDDNVRQLLVKMLKSGELVQPRAGIYSLPTDKPEQQAA